MNRMNADAVSPVVGVMLMLVVTIIIAAVVSAFAGGVGGSQEKTPQVSITAEPVVQAFADEDKTNSGADYPTGFTAANGILFENTGGDTFRLNDINVLLDAGGTKYTITSADKLNDPSVSGSGGWGADLASDLTDGGYFLKVGGTSQEDKTIGPGDKFMLYADGHYDSSESTQKSASNGKYLVWRPKGTSGGIGAQFGTKCRWTIVDRETNKPMASGYVVFK